MEKGDPVLIRNLPERGGTGKVRPFWEDKVQVENITCTVKSENDLNGKIHTLHRNMLLSCDNLLDNYNWNINREYHIDNNKSKDDIKQTQK